MGNRTPYIIDGGLVVRGGPAQLASIMTDPSVTFPSGSIWSGVGGDNDYYMTYRQSNRRIEHKFEWRTANGPFTVPNEPRLGYFVNSLGQPTPWTIKLPSGPVLGQQIIFSDRIGTFQTRNVTINGNGKKIRGSTNDYTLRDNWKTIEFVYSGDDAGGWQIAYGGDVLNELHLGDAATRDVGRNDGQIPLVGYFGLGGGLGTSEVFSTYYPSNDLNDADRTGFWSLSGAVTAGGVVLQDATTEGNFSGMVFHFQRNFPSGPRATQMLFSIYGMLYRVKQSDGTWADWVSMAGRSRYLSSGNLDSIVRNGTYFINNPVNGPTSVPAGIITGYLTVMDAGDYSQQLLQRMTFSAGNRLRTYTRRRIDSTTWTLWTREVNDDYAYYWAKSKPVVRLPFDKLSMTAKRIQLPDGFVFKRSSVGSYYSADGVIRSAPIDRPRLTCSPKDGTNIGLIVEGDSANLVLNANKVQAANNQVTVGTFNGQPIIEGFVPTAVIGNVNTSVPVSGLMAAQPEAFAIPGGNGTLSFYINPIAADVDGVQVTVSTSGMASASTMVINLKTATVAGVSTAGVYAVVERYQNGWFRIGITGDWLNSGGTGLNFLSISPVKFDQTGNFTSLSLANYRGISLFALDGFQFELLAKMTSFIKTTGTIGTRAQDIVVLNKLGPKYNPIQGTLIVHAQVDDSSGALLSGGLSPILVNMDDSTSGDPTQNCVRMVQYGNGGGNRRPLFGVQTLVAGTFRESYSRVALPVFGRAIAAITYAKNVYTWHLNGMQTGQISTSPIPTMDRFTIGSSAGQTGGKFYGVISSIEYHNIAMTNDQLENVTDL